MIARLAYAVLAGVVAFLIAVVIGTILHIGVIIAYAGLIGVLVALVYYLQGPNNRVL